MKKIILGFILGGIVFTLGGVVATTAISSTNVTYQNKTVNNALDELYNEAITGKELVAAAITNKGITTTSNDTYEVMASNINNIDTDHTEINQKISNLESKHNSDIASLTGSISNLNQSLTWKKLGRYTGTQKFQIPQNCNEILIRVYHPMNGYVSKTYQVLEFNKSSTEYIHVLAGWFYMEENNGLVNITDKDGYLNLRMYWLNSADTTAQATVDVWYR